MDTENIVDYRVEDWMRKNRIPRSLTVQESKANIMAMNACSKSIYDRKALKIALSGVMASILEPNAHIIGSKISTLLASGKNGDAQTAKAVKSWVLGAVVGVYAKNSVNRTDDLIDNLEEITAESLQLPLDFVHKAINRFNVVEF
jgi:hypothetical protein